VSLMAPAEPRKISKIVFLLPRGPLYRYGTGAFGRFIRYAPLTLPTLISLIPEDIKAEVEVYDEGVEVIKKEKIQGDLIAISSITGASRRAYAYADYFRGKGMTVVMGGVHATLMPEEASAHADAIVTGIAVHTWPRLLRDFEKGELRKSYHQEGPVDFSGWPIPRRDCYDSKKLHFITTNSVQATYGCPNQCDFCVTPHSCKGYHHRPIEDVIREISAIKARHIAFVDPSPIEDLEYAKALYRAMIPLRKKWVSPATIKIAADRELLDLAAASGCRGLLIGFETVTMETLVSIKKGFNTATHYADAVKELHRKGIAIMGCFVFGLDGDDTGVFRRTVDFINEVSIDLPRFTVCTPYPGTAFYDRLREEGRIIEDDWSLYDCQHVVFSPSLMSADELQQGLYRAWKETFRTGAVLKRLLSSRAFLGVMLLTNFTYRAYGRRLPFYTREVMTDLGDITGPQAERSERR
jgi:radical SAM superfamily enzyme YgiQ (UPF0313 family)